MAKVIFKRGTDTKTIPVKDGQLVYNTETGEHYIDVGDRRVPLGTGGSSGKDYITPEQFGAKGDGQTDDSLAFAQALADGRPIVGDTSKVYLVNSLKFPSYTHVSNCSFFGNNKNKGVDIASHSVIENCKFSGFLTAAMYSDQIPVGTTVRDCIFQYNENGAVFEMLNGSQSVNQLRFEDNYFVKNGADADNPSGAITEGKGYGLKAFGNICNLVATGNVFEYNTNCGILFGNSSSDFRVGAVIADNYFEGNRGSAITLDFQTNVAMSLTIHDNYYSRLSGYVRGVLGIASGKEKQNIGSTEGIIEDLDGPFTIRASSTAGMIGMHSLKFDKSNTDAHQSFMAMSLRNVWEDRNILEISYIANVKSPVTFTNQQTGEKAVVDKKGVGTFYTGFGYSWALSRNLAPEESFTITRMIPV